MFYLFLTAAQSSRSLWYDELFTYYIAKAPSLGQLWQDIHLDLNPPLMYLIERLSLNIFGDHLYTARVPSMLGFLLGSLCFYKFVANRLGFWYGIVALVFFWASPFEYFATEARPYGVVVGLFGVAMLAWQQSTGARRSALSLMAFALAILTMMCTHLLALFYVVPFGIAELYRWYRTRRFDLPTWASLVVPAAIPFVYTSLMSRYGQSAFPASTQASPAKILGFFYRMLEPQGLFVLFALCLGLLVSYRGARPTNRDLQEHSFSKQEWIFIWSLFLIPVLINFAMMRSHGIAYPRYSGPAVLLLSILFAVLLGLSTGFSRSAAAAASCVLLLYLAGANAGSALGAVHALRTRGAQPEPGAVAKIRPDLPLVAASGLKFLEMDKYSDPGTISRLYYLTGRALAIQYAHATIFEGMPDIKEKFPIRAHVEPYEHFVAEHPSFLVLGEMYYPEDWLLRRLSDIHASLQFLGNYSGAQLYLVTMPGHPVPEITDSLPVAH